VLFVEADGELVWDRATNVDRVDTADAGRVREAHRLRAPSFRRLGQARADVVAKKTGRGPGRPAGQPGVTLEQVADPDIIEPRWLSMRTATSGEVAMIRPLTRIVLKNSGRSAGWLRMYRHSSSRSPARSRPGEGRHVRAVHASLVASTIMTAFGVEEDRDSG
jgi:hypothetical protein